MALCLAVLLPRYLVAWLPHRLITSLPRYLIRPLIVILLQTAHLRDGPRPLRPYSHNRGCRRRKGGDEMHPPFESCLPHGNPRRVSVLPKRSIDDQIYIAALDTLNDMPIRNQVSIGRFIAFTHRLHRQAHPAQHDCRSTRRQEIEAQFV